MKSATVRMRSALWLSEVRDEPVASAEGEVRQDPLQRPVMAGVVIVQDAEARAGAHRLALADGARAFEPAMARAKSSGMKLRSGEKMRSCT